MTEEKLAPKGQTASKRRIIGLVLAVLATFVAALWLFRQPLAEAIARSVCEGQKLSCQLSITQLDFGGVTLTGLEARAPSAKDAAVTAKELSVDLAWDSPFSPRPRVVAGDDLIVRLDLTGKRSPLGDLETAITNFTKPSEKPPGPTPQLSFTKITVIGDTLSGPVQAQGTIKATGPDAFVIDLAAPAATLGLSGATVQLAGGQLKATVAGQQITGALKLDLARFEATDTRIADVKIDATLEQVTGVLKGSGTASLGAVTVKDTSFTAAQAKASIESAPINTSGFSLNTLLAGVRKLQLDAATGEGSIAGTTWHMASLTASIQPTAANRSGGDFLLAADDIKFPQGAAGRIELAGKANIAEGVAGNASGTLNVRSAIVLTQSRKELVDAVALPLQAALPAFGDAAAAATNRAAQNFDVTAPWTASASKEALVFTLMTGAQLKAASGLTLSLVAPTAKQEVISLTTAGRGSWTGAGSLQLAGGGAPPFSLDVARATGGEGRVSIAATASLKPWKVASDSLSADFSGGEFDLDGNAGKATGQLAVNLDGSLGGGIWKGARGAGRVDAVWDDKSFAADAPQGAVIQWREARYGDTVFGAAALRYTPLGRLAENQGEGLVGRGTLASVSVPVNGGGWTAKTVLGATGINWRASDGFRANFNMAPSTVDMSLDQRKIPIRIADISGELDLRNGWRVTGGFSGGSAQADEATLADLAGKFNIAGKGDAIDGTLSNVAVRIFDPNKEDDRRYEEAKFNGGATLKDSIVNFTGQVAMAKSGMQVAHITGSHSLKTNAGSLTYDPTPLIFARTKFQPYDLSPLLRGPANVEGRADIAGGASWSDKGLKANASVDLKKIGFTLASAGVFEGVSGRVEVADLLNMKSAPGQQITIDKVTLGLPIEKGTIKFKLTGYEDIGLESAEWPFGGGFIRVKPMSFKFAAGDTNRIVAQAVDWDLEKLIDQFKVPDLKLKGIVSGDFPVTFSTGSARIDNAVLEANKTGGVIQYSGSAGDAAAQADENSQRLFDALKDFRYTVLKIGLNGDLAGRIMMSLSVQGKNPDVLGGTPFNLNIGIDSELVQLLQNAAGMFDARTVISQTKGGQQ
ncbi:MAG: YdbH domain-containing protein [Hyphomonadaceae bacterium]